MSKQKAKVIPPLFQDYDDLWWQYREYGEQQLQSVDDFFKKNAKEMPNYITNDFFQTLSNLHKLIGAKAHPVLAQEPFYFQENTGSKNQGQLSQEELGQNQGQIPSQLNNGNPQNNGEVQDSKSVFLLFQNTRIDSFSLKLLQLILPNFPNFCALKFCSNNFSQQQCTMLLQLLNQPNCPISKLFFEWNHLQNDLQLSFIPELGSTALEFLVLRSCQITDDAIISMLENFKSNSNIRIKYLELYNNSIRGEGLRAIGQFMETYMKLEYVGLAKNGISNLDDVLEIFHAVGKKILSAEELQLYRDKEKERETMITKAAKNKKKVPEDQLPHIDPIVQMPDGQFAILRNLQMKMINLSMNNLTEADGEALEKYLAFTNEDFQIILFHNNFEGKYKEKLKKKYRKNIQI